MTPLPTNPKLLINLDKEGNLLSFATNVSPELEVVKVYSWEQFADKARGLPFVTSPAYDPRSMHFKR